MGKFTKIFNLSSPTDPKESVITIDRDYRDYVRFGSDNLFPQAIAELNRKSTVNRALIKSKTTYTIGQGFKTENEQLKAFLQEVNPARQSLRNITKSLIRDKYEFGNGWIEIVTNPSKAFLSLFHVDSTTVRIEKSGEKVLIHPDWSKYESTMDLATPVGIYPNFTEGYDGLLHSVVQLNDYEPEFYYYGIPDWIAAMKVATIGHKTDKWNLSRLENNFRLSGVLVVEDDIKDDDDANKLQSALIDNFTGEGNNSKLMAIVKEPGQNQATTFTPLTTSDEGDWQKLHEQSSADMVVGHNWRRSLIGFSDNTGFDTDRILNDYSDVLFNVVQPEQESYLETFRMIFSDFGYDAEDLDFINAPPVDPKRTTLTAPQIKEVSIMNAQVKAGVLSQDAAVNLLMISLLIKKEQAEGLLL